MVVTMPLPPVPALKRSQAIGLSELVTLTYLKVYETEMYAT